MAGPPLALQLYTVRDETEKDFAGTVRQVAQIGYRGVELAGYGGMSVQDVDHLLTSLNLVVAGNHVKLSRLENDLNVVTAECNTLGCEFLVCPAMPPERRNADGFRWLADTLNRIGGTVRSQGVKLCYHNHAFEWDTQIDNEPAYDWLVQHTDPNLVAFEMDVYWMKKAGQDPVHYLNTFSGRVPLLHIKDMTKDERQTFAPVGTGSMDFGPIFTAAEYAGVTWYIVEQDKAEGSSIEAARTSFENLRKMGRA